MTIGMPSGQRFPNSNTQNFINQPKTHQTTKPTKKKILNFYLQLPPEPSFLARFKKKTIEQVQETQKSFKQNLTITHQLKHPKLHRSTKNASINKTHKQKILNFYLQLPPEPSFPVRFKKKTIEQVQETQKIIQTKSNNNPSTQPRRKPCRKKLKHAADHTTPIWTQKTQKSPPYHADLNFPSLTSTPDPRPTPEQPTMREREM